MEKLKNYRMIGIIVLIILVGIGYHYYSDRKEKENTVLPLYNNESMITKETSTDTNNGATEEIEQPEMIQIDIKGAVKKPGVYSLEMGKRIHDAISLAGGTTEEADTTLINLAAYINDGQMIYIPKIGEDPSQWLTHSNVQGFKNTTGKVNINTASKAELEELPGIGASKAEAIIAYRTEHGAFADVQELTKVTGIGEKTLEKLLPYISVK